MKDDKLDKIFQDAAQGVDFGDGATGWNDLKAKLGHGGATSKPTNGRAAKWLLGLLVLLLITVGGGVLWNYMEDEPSNNQLAESNDKAENVSNMSSAIDTTASSPNQNTAQQNNISNEIVESNTSDTQRDGVQPGKSISDSEQSAEPKLALAQLGNIGAEQKEVNTSTSVGGINGGETSESVSINRETESGNLKDDDAAKVANHKKSLESLTSTGASVSNSTAIKKNDVSSSTETVGDVNEKTSLNNTGATAASIDSHVNQETVNSRKTQSSLEEVLPGDINESDGRGALALPTRESTLVSDNTVHTSGDNQDTVGNSTPDQSGARGAIAVDINDRGKQDSLPLSNSSIISTRDQASTLSVNQQAAEDLKIVSSDSEKKRTHGNISGASRTFSSSSSSVSPRPNDFSENDKGSDTDRDTERNEDPTQSAGNDTESKNKSSDLKSSELSFLDHKGIESDSLTEPELVKLAKTDAELAKIVDELDDEDIPFKRSRWSFGVEFSPDLSGTGIGRVEDSGFNLGLNVEYHINSRFSINGGVVYAKKLYFAEEGLESYDAVNPNWVLDRVNANCDVLDIPINLNYYVAGRERSGFVFSTGFSTYLMLTEDYQIIYNDPWPEGAASVRNENTHFFGIVNASIGYKKILNPTLSLQVEPFVKLPIQGIGEGDLDLFTSGLRLTLKYNRISINR